MSDNTAVIGTSSFVERGIVLSVGKKGTYEAWQTIVSVGKCVSSLPPLTNDPTNQYVTPMMTVITESWNPNEESTQNWDPKEKDLQSPLWRRMESEYVCAMIPSFSLPLPLSDQTGWICQPSTMKNKSILQKQLQKENGYTNESKRSLNCINFTWCMTTWEGFETVNHDAGIWPNGADGIIGQSHRRIMGPNGRLTPIQ